MNAYTTRARARIQSCDMARALLTDPSMAALSLAALERIRGYQAEAEETWLLKQHRVPPVSAASLAVTLRQTIGAAFVRAGERLAGAPQRAIALEPYATVGKVGTASDRCPPRLSHLATGCH
jgi:hypothetical protein